MANTNNHVSDLLSKMDDKMMKAKLNSAVDALKKGNLKDLEKKVGKIDKDKLLKDLDQMLQKDSNKISALNLNELKNKVTNDDMAKLSQILGPDNEEIVNKIKSILQ